MNPTTFYHIAAFLAGTAVMGVEISASRLLAPYFGSSMITWTILIGIILTAMSLGSRYGGRLADSCDRPDRLFRLLFWCGIWVALIPWVGRYLMVASFFGMAVLVPGQAVSLGVMVSCLLIFAPPSFVLGMVTPFLLRFTISDTASTGRVAGDLGALSTVGSIIGTFLPTFVTIPFLGSTRTFMLFASVLCALSAVYFRFVAPEPRPAFWKGLLPVLLLVALTLLPIRASFAFWTTPMLESESVYNYLRLEREDGGHQLSTHTLIGRQSLFRSDGVLTGNYWDYALIGPFFRQGRTFRDPIRVLALGFGAGTLARIFRFYFPACSVTGVELDPAIAALGTTHFGLTPEDATVVVEDARTFVTRTNGHYDLIVLDAFHDISIPFHLTTVEFWKTVQQRLATDAAVVVNFNMPLQADRELSDSLLGSMKAVFPRVHACTIRNQVNSIFIATMDPGATAPDPLQEQIGFGHPLLGVFEDFAANHREIATTAHILTDDHAPVEWMAARALGRLLSEGLDVLTIRVIHQLRFL